MPIMDGFESTKKIREFAQNCGCTTGCGLQTQIIALTAYTN